MTRIMADGVILKNGNAKLYGRAGGIKPGYNSLKDVQKFYQKLSDPFSDMCSHKHFEVEEVLADEALCGIVGYLGKKHDPSEVIIEGLKNLEYRGYDSAGILVLEKNGFKYKKVKGKIKYLQQELEKAGLGGTIGIGHTRWATHGWANVNNAHPQISNDGAYAVVHNGIIENAKQLDELLVWLSEKPENIVKLAHLIKGEKAEKIMLIDDDPEVLEREKKYFKKEYSNVITAAKDDALSIFDAEKPDVVFIDLYLPDPQAGFALIKQIKTRSPQTRVVVISAHADHADIDKAVEKYGADDFVAKGDKKKLLGKVPDPRRAALQEKIESLSKKIDIKAVEERIENSNPKSLNFRRPAKIQTDTNVVPRLAQLGYLLYGNDRDGIRESLKLLEGAFALGIASAHDESKNKLYAMKETSPLILGKSLDGQEVFIASDFPAIGANIAGKNHKAKITYVEDGDFVEISRDAATGAVDIKLTDLDGNKVERKDVEETYDPTKMGFGGEVSRTMFEIKEQEEAFKAAIEKFISGNKIDFPGTLLSDGKTRIGGLNLTKDQMKKFNKVLIIGCGTAWHAGLLLKDYFEYFAGMPAEAIDAAEQRYRLAEVCDENTLVIAYSQSGETADTKAAVESAKSKGATVVGIINARKSSIARDVDPAYLKDKLEKANGKYLEKLKEEEKKRVRGGVIYLECGPEFGVASTKAYTSMGLTGLLLAMKIGQERGTMKESSEEVMEQIKALPKVAKWVLENTTQPERHNYKVLKAIVKDLIHQRGEFFMGRLGDKTTAFEAALKLKELSYLNAQGYGSAEMKHGPIALFDEKFSALVISTIKRLAGKNASNAKEVASRKGRIYSIVSDDVKGTIEDTEGEIIVPHLPEFLSPLISIIPLQILAHEAVMEIREQVGKPLNAIAELLDKTFGEYAKNKDANSALARIKEAKDSFVKSKKEHAFARQLYSEEVGEVLDMFDRAIEVIEEQHQSPDAVKAEIRKLAIKFSNEETIRKYRFGPKHILKEIQMFKGPDFMSKDGKELEEIDQIFEISCNELGEIFNFDPKELRRRFGKAVENLDALIPVSAVDLEDFLEPDGLAKRYWNISVDQPRNLAKSVTVE